MAPTFQVVLTDDVQKILDSFGAAFGIRIIFFSPGGEVLRVGQKQQDSEFCRCVRALYGERRCLELDERMRLVSQEQGGRLTYRCHAGLVESVCPIVDGHNLLGYAMIGQFRVSTTVEPEVTWDWSVKFGNDRLARAYENLPFYDQERTNHIVDLFGMLVDYLISRDFVSARSNLTVDRIAAWIDERIASPRITVAEAAHLVGRSESSVSHLVSRYTGKSFKRLVAEKRIDRAANILILRPESPIAEVAEAVGFRDQFYFSKTFKKLRGVSPTGFIKRHRSGQG